MTRRRRPSTTPYGRGPPPHGFAAGRIWMSAHHPKAALSAGVAQRKRAAHCRTALPFSTRRWKTLTLLELEAAAGLGLAVFLTLDAAAVAGIGRAACRERV